MEADAYIKLIGAAIVFIVAAMAMVILIWRDSRPRPNDFTSIIRRVDSPPRRPVHHHNGYCRRIGCKEDNNDERMGSEE
jgi:hypothetical protein